MTSFFLNHPRETDLALFAGGELGPLARWRIERHLDKCDRCQTEVADFFHLQSDLSDLAELPAVDFQALAHRIKVAAAQAQPETDSASVAGWFRQPAAWQVGMVSATALCAFLIYNQLPPVKTVPESVIVSSKNALGSKDALGDAVQAERQDSNPSLRALDVSPGSARPSAIDQLGHSKASAPAEEEARRAFADHRLEGSVSKSDAARDLDDSESARQKAKQIIAPTTRSVAVPAQRVSRRADSPALEALAKVNRTTINRTIGGTAEGLSSTVADELEESPRSNTELANTRLQNGEPAIAELVVNEKIHRGASDAKVALASGEAPFKKESSGALQDTRTGAYFESAKLDAQIQDVQSRDNNSPRSQPAQAPASALLGELEEADLSASATPGRLRAASEERSDLRADQVDKDAPADPDDQLQRVAGARKPVTLAVNKRPAESRTTGQEAGTGKSVAELEKSGVVSGGVASDRTSNAETFANDQFSVLHAAWNDSNTEVGVAADGGMMIRALDSATGTITITNVYLH
jgi:hypothetical protein